jgi:hypothetical protein
VADRTWPEGGAAREERSHIHWSEATGKIRSCPPGCDHAENVKRIIIDWPAEEQHCGDRVITGWVNIDG